MTFRNLHTLKYSQDDKDRFPFSREKRKDDDERSAFEIDRSRIIHSSAFRRLQSKTQVFSLGEGDFLRTRLTHSLEVAQIGKGLALRLKADTDLVEAICLAHDLGHAPFGHAGGKALAERMRHKGGFEANAQNIQLLCKLEKRKDNYDGLNLTRATIDGILKYKEKYDPKKNQPETEKYDAKKNQRRFYYADGVSPEVIDWATKDSIPNAQSFECQIMDWADEIAYSVHDFEDALHAGLLSASEIMNPALFDKVSKELREKKGWAQTLLEEQWQSLLKQIRGKIEPPSPNPRVKRANRKQLTSVLIGEFIHNVKRAEITGQSTDRYRYKLEIPVELRVRQQILNKIVDVMVMQSANVQTLEAKGVMFIKSLFDSLTSQPSEIFPDDWRGEVLTHLGNDEAIARLACDYVSGMTDTFAEKLYCRLFIPGSGSVHDAL